jgi:hypothetical protein
MLFSVPGARSSLGLPATVTSPLLSGCLNCRWLPRVRATYHPSASMIPITSRTFTSPFPGCVQFPHYMQLLVTVHTSPFPSCPGHGSCSGGGPAWPRPRWDWPGRTFPSRAEDRHAGTGSSSGCGRRERHSLACERPESAARPGRGGSRTGIASEAGSLVTSNRDGSVRGPQAQLGGAPGTAGPRSTRACHVILRPVRGVQQPRSDSWDHRAHECLL